jgi:methoxymalonate biosynthesis acyl carrier protein
MNEIRETIRQFILSKYLPTERPENLRDDTPLQTSGLLDSLAAVNLVNFVEDHFNVKLDIRDTGVERFDRIEDIAALITRKRAC